MPSSGTPITKTLSYDKANQLAKYVEQQDSQVTKYYLYSRDKNGNRTAQNPIGGLGQTLKYVYDQEDRLTGLNPSEAVRAIYTYNGDGLRMSKYTCGNPCATSNFTWDVAGIPLLLRDRQASYIYGPGGMLLEQVSASGTPYFYHADHQGSIRAMTDKNGYVVNTYNYDPYGNRTASTGSVYNPFGYTGEYTDSEAGEYGFIYLRARYYDPVTEQFFTRDPSGDVEEPYAYVGGSPVNGTDPMGLRPLGPGVVSPTRLPTGMWGWPGQGVSYCADPDTCGITPVGHGGMPCTQAYIEAGVCHRLDAPYIGDAPAAGLGAIAGTLGGRGSVRSSGPSFVGTEGGECVTIPTGARLGTVTTGKGYSYLGGSGGPGLNSRVTGVRIMNPTPRYPKGYVVYMNEAGHTVNPFTGQQIPPSDPLAHLPLK